MVPDMKSSLGLSHVSHFTVRTCDPVDAATIKLLFGFEVLFAGK
jgi:hypothetical protein